MMPSSPAIGGVVGVVVAGELGAERIRQRYPVGGAILGDVPNLEAARHERYSILVGATGSKSPHADILQHGAQAAGTTRKVGPNTARSSAT